LVATPPHTTHVWRFGVFEVDAQKEEVCRAGHPIKVREQSFRILVHLLENAGDLVTREDLRKALWPEGTYVDFDHSVNTAVMKLREALGDTADKPLYIETLPKRGYRFIAPITEVEEPRIGFAPAGGSSGSPNERTSTTPPITVSPNASPVPHRRLGRLAAAVGMLILAGAGSFIYFVRIRSQHPAQNSGANPRSFQIIPVTTAPGAHFGPALSPDGRDVAYSWDRPGRSRLDVYVLRVGSDTPLRRTHLGGSIGFPAWSPDGRVIAFSRCEGKNGSVYLIPALSGPERKLTNVGCQFNYPSPLAWSEDGSQLLMIDRCSSAGSFGLVLFSFLDGGKRCLIDSGPRGFETRYEFAISPDRRTVAFIPTIESKTCEIYTMPITGGTPHPVLKDAHFCRGIMWTPEGRSIVFGSQRTTLGSLWRVSVKGGELERETMYPAIGSFSNDGRHFVYSEPTMREPPSIWRADLAEAGGRVLSNRKLISTQYDELDAQPSPNGERIVWMSARTGSREIWESEATGENPQQLTRLVEYAGTPRWSPDGKWIVFDNSRPEGIQIRVVDSDGRNLHTIVGGPYPNVVPSWSRDGKSIYFASKRTGKMEVWKHSLDSGQELQLTTHGGFDAIESVDGRTVYFSKFDEAGIWSIPPNGGTETLVVQGKPQVLYWGHWAVTRTGLYFLNVEAEPMPRVEYFDFATHNISAVFPLEKRPAYNQPSLGATLDGKTIYYAQQDSQSAVKMIEFPH
jgi:Tol biopolymer transport system component/DNA-binding winged helix-turn-helix (wHTH) protein